MRVVKNYSGLMVLAFIGQLIAAPLISIDNCQMDISENSILQMASMPEHDMMQMNSTQDDCCDTMQCECTQGMCLTQVQGLSIHQKNRLQLVTTESYDKDSSSLKLHQSITSIYRPPIIS